MKQRFIKNTLSSIILQIVTIACGFILPRLILSTYGSEVNGLIQSISQFLGVITFLEMGVGQVVQSSLYSPIVQKNNKHISIVIKSAELFFNKLAKILFLYTALLLFFYPMITKEIFDRFYVMSLIVVIAASMFAQYYYGIIDNLLLNADQKVYIQNISQILSVIFNTFICILLMRWGAGIHVVKIATSIIYILRPFAIRIYVNKKYRIDRNISYKEEPIKQKWNGIAQHVSGFVLAGTDNIVLTIFSTLQNISIYSVYHIIVYGIHQLYQSATAGVHSLVGNLWAEQKFEELYKIYGYIEMILHFSTVFLFSCTAILLIPFIEVYTDGILDVNYIHPLFGMLLVVAHASQCLKTTYNIMILAGGHYKQTQSCHIISAILNLFISIAMVIKYGLIGVALGTCVSMVYQMTWMAWYNSKNFIYWPFKNFLKQIIVDILTVVIIMFATSWITLQAKTYISWTIMAIKVAIVACVIVMIVAYVVYPTRIKELYRFVRKEPGK